MIYKNGVRVAISPDDYWLLEKVDGSYKVVHVIYDLKVGHVRVDNWYDHDPVCRVDIPETMFHLGRKLSPLEALGSQAE